MSKVIKFWKAGDQYGEFSNYSLHQFELDGVVWPSVENYFQASKFNRDDQSCYRELIRTCNPHNAKRLGNSRDFKIRRDWERVKDDVMARGLEAKFVAHDSLRSLLISTGDARLVEASPYDSYWGTGPSGYGLNKLGVMDLRSKLIESNLSSK